MEFIEKQSAQYPDLASRYQLFGRLYTEKLYHQLTIEVEKFVKDPQCKKSDNFIQLYNEFLQPIQGKLNQLKLVQIASTAAKQFKCSQDGVGLLQLLLDANSSHLGEEACFLCRMEIASLKFSQGTEFYSEIKKIIEDNKTVLEGLTGCEPVIHASYYAVACKYYRANGPPETFYKNALMFLAYSTYENMEHAERYDLATDISISALTGVGVFNFGEVLATPILKALEGTPKQWLSDLLHAFSRGDIDKFNDILSTNNEQYCLQPALVNKKDYIKEKVTLLALMELVFHLPSHERNIPFMDIAQHTRLPLEQVEWLVMRAMSLDLIKGTIDQINQIVRVTWVQPRVLDKTQLQNLNERFDVWKDKVNETLLFVEGQTPELFQ